MKTDDPDVFFISEDNSLRFATEFFESRNLKVRRITSKTHPHLKKIPDLEISSQDGALFYAEVKTPELKLDKQSNSYRHTTTLSKISDLTHTAVKQFKSANSLHLVPNVIVWNSGHFQLNFHSFSEALKGKAELNGNVFASWRNHMSWKRLSNDNRIVDLHIWNQVTDNGIDQTAFFPMINDPRLQLILNNMLKLQNIPVHKV